MIPPQKSELDKFLKKSEAITRGEKPPSETDFEENKLGESNLGFQLLKKAGWTEGGGLGAGGSGIAEPVQMSTRNTDDAGVGVRATHEVEADDDAFDQYRKRMMLAYRFRPNPLNNPRRNYY
jgi:splicing factor 4